jgi:hypothetical protein
LACTAASVSSTRRRFRLFSDGISVAMEFIGVIGRPAGVSIVEVSESELTTRKGKEYVASTEDISDHAGIAKFLEFLEYLLLAISQAGSYIAEKSTSISKHLQMYNEGVARPG